MPLEFNTQVGDHHLLLSIDGTGSAKWRDSGGQNSHVRRFFNDFGGHKKAYLDGPDTLGFLMIDRILDGVRWVLDEIQNLIMQGIKQENIKLNLVGHSRGGFGVLKIAEMLQSRSTWWSEAKSLNRPVESQMHGLKRVIESKKNISYPIKINFIGLYDAVDSTAGIDINISTQNVRMLANAVRKSANIKNRIDAEFFKSTSRPYMFKSLLVLPWAHESFDTSHGGIGGDPGFFEDPYSLADLTDLYCNAMPIILTENELKIRDRWWTKTLTPELKLNRIMELKNYWKNSQAADNYIRNRALMAGVPLIGSSLFVPWHSSKEEYGRRLKMLINGIYDNVNLDSTALL